MRELAAHYNLDETCVTHLSFASYLSADPSRLLCLSVTGADAVD